MSLTVFLDMDGVLADFNTRCADVFGQPEKGTFEKDPPLVENSAEHFGFEDAHAFWQAIGRHGAFDFWSRIEPMPWCNILYNRLFNAPFVDRVLVCTSPARNPDSAKAKLMWLQGQIGGLSPFRDWVLVPSEHKHYLAGPNRVLIDDRESNIEDWRSAGGIGYLFPMPWNREGKDVDWQVRPGSPGYQIALIRPLLESLESVSKMGT